LRAVEEGFLREQDFLRVLISTLRSGDVFLDVGASIGLLSIPIAKVVGERGQVIAFEPEPQAYKKLLNHLQLNGLSNVRVLRKALGEQSAQGRLFVGGSACPSLVAHIGDPGQQSISEDIDVVQGDLFFHAEGLAPPCAVKIDVEGYEYSVLRGLERTLAHPACELVCCEIHPSFLPPDVTVEAIVELVRSAGFSRIDLPLSWGQIHMIARKGSIRRATD
jgi:FkbM family methyltransferase